MHSHAYAAAARERGRARKAQAKGDAKNAKFPYGKVPFVAVDEITGSGVATAGQSASFAQMCAGPAGILRKHVGREHAGGVSSFDVKPAMFAA
jgi:hypothetical protein